MKEEIFKIEAGAQFLKDKLKVLPQVALVLGSGLGELAEYINEKETIPYSQVPHLPLTTAPGHKGEFVFGNLKGLELVMMKGRFHYYEGYEPWELVRPLRVLASLGLKVLVVTNAAGAINKNYNAGDLMFISDHLNMTGYNPLRGENYPEGPRFPDMSYGYNEKLLALAQRAAQKIGQKVHKGIYVGVAGPNFETPAEIEMFRRLGADAVGMSTVPEVLAANHLGLKVLGISLMSNMAAGILPVKLSHEEVLAIGTKAKPSFFKLLLEILSEKEFADECR